MRVLGGWDKIKNATANNVCGRRLIVGGDFNLDARDVPPVLEVRAGTRLVRVAPSNPTCCFEDDMRLRRPLSLAFDYFLVSEAYRVLHTHTPTLFASDHLPTIVTIEDNMH